MTVLNFPPQRQHQKRAPGTTGAASAGDPSSSLGRKPLSTPVSHSRSRGEAKAVIQQNLAAHRREQEYRNGMTICVVVVSAVFVIGLLGFLATKGIANLAYHNVNPTHFCGEC